MSYYKMINPIEGTSEEFDNFTDLKESYNKLKKECPEKPRVFEVGRFGETEFEIEEEKDEKKVAPNIIFATPRVGICYSYPENCDDEEKPYVSLDFITGLILARQKFIMDELKKEGLEETKKYILASAGYEIDTLLERIMSELNKVLKEAEEDEL